MKKLIFRILAFTLDVLLCSLIVYGISLIDFINPYNKELKSAYNSVYKNTENYNELYKKLDDLFADGMITNGEFRDISVKYPVYREAFTSIELNEAIKNKEIETIKDKIDELNVKFNTDSYIRINKLNWLQVIISLIVYILYFGLLQYLLKGQTPFKRLFRLKVVKKKGGNPSLLSFVIRALLVSEIIISLLDVTLLFNLVSEKYVIANTWLTQIKYIYEMSFLVCMLLRDDMRSIHDLLLGTEVIRYDKSGKKVEDTLFLKEDDNDDKKIVNKDDKSLSKNAH